MGEMVSIPVEEYQRLLAIAEDAEDRAAFDRVKQALAAGEEELIPEEFVSRLIAGESPVRVWREYRGLTQVALAEKSRVNRVQISNIESGAKTGSVDTLKKLAQALGVALDDLV